MMKMVIVMIIINIIANFFRFDHAYILSDRGVFFFRFVCGRNVLLTVFLQTVTQI